MLFINFIPSKRTNHFKFCLLFFGILLLLVNCKEEDFIEQEELINEVLVSYNVTSLDNLVEIKPIIENLKNSGSEELSYARSTTNFDSLTDINIDEIIQYTNETGYSTYTFKFENESETINFENLYLIEVENGYIGYILSFEPEMNWYSNHLYFDGSLNFDNYEGEITKYSLEREVIWTTKSDSNRTTFSRSTTSSRGSGEFIQICVISEPSPCLEFRHSYEQGWDGCAYSDGQYHESCQTVFVGGGGTNFPDNENPEDGPGGGTTTGGEDCTNVSGTSIVDELPISGISGDCAPNEVIGVFPIKLDEIFTDQNFEENPCLISVYEAMGKTTKFNEYLQNFDPEFSVANLRFTTDDNFANTFEYYTNAMAVTSPPLSSNEIKITFNTDPNTTGNILDKPDVFRAVAMIHELLHAEMFRKMLDAVIAAEINQTNLQWDTWPNNTDFGDFIESLENKYFGIFDFYTRYEWDTPTPNAPQHQLMADRYRNIVKQTLTDYDPTLTSSQKEALSWIGLNNANIVAWQNLTPTQQSTINNTITQIKNTFPNECN